MYIHGIYDYNCAQVIKMKTVYICQNKLGPQVYIMFIKNENFFIRNVSGKLTFKKSNKCSKAKAHKSLLQIFSQTFLDYATHLAFMHLAKSTNLSLQDFKEPLLRSFLFALIRNPFLFEYIIVFESVDRWCGCELLSFFIRMKHCETV